MTALSFVNIHGQTVNVSATKKKTTAKRSTSAPESYHRGWRVSGVSPERIAEAIEDAAKRAARDRIDGKPVEDFNVELWIANASAKPVRAKAYGIPEAAHQCAELARKAGWRAAQVIELKKSKD